MSTPSHPTRALLFSLITLGISWACWVPHLPEIQADLFASNPRVLLAFFAGAYSPFFTALLLTGLFEGRAGIGALLRNLVSIRRGRWWNLAAFAAGPAVVATALWLHSRDFDLGTFNRGALPWLPVLVLVCVTLGPLAEELGWRGYLLPHLNFKARPLRATLITASIWTVWHAPLFWAATGTAISGAPVTAATLAIFTAGIFAWSALYSWFALKTNGSVFTALMVHLGANTGGAATALLFPQLKAIDRIDIHALSVVLLGGVIVLGFIAHRLSRAGQSGDGARTAAKRTAT